MFHLRRLMLMAIGVCGVGSFVTTPGLAQIRGWRGDGSGKYFATQPPTHWSATENVVWAADLPGPGNASPVIHGDRVFVCSEPFLLLCLNRADGKLLWQRDNALEQMLEPETWKELAPGVRRRGELRDNRQTVEAELKRLKDGEPSDQSRAEIARLERQLTAVNAELDDLQRFARYELPITHDEFNGYSTPTPVTDGQFVWAVFGNRAVVCYDLEGRRIWHTVLPDEPHSMWGHASSPLLVGGRLIVNIEDTVGLDAATGIELWRTRFGQTWGSPVASAGGRLVLLPNGRVLRTEDGKVLARSVPLSNASPLVDGSTVYYIDCAASAFSIPEDLPDDTQLAPLWKQRLPGRQFYASPVVHDGLIYGVATNQVLSVIDAATGEMVYSKRIDLGAEPAWQSLCAAGDYIYISGRDGTTIVLRAGRTWQEVARNKLEYFISTPAFHENRAYIRTRQHLFCIGRPSSG